LGDGTAKQAPTEPTPFRRMFIPSGNSRNMKTSIQLIEKIIRAKTALHLKLVARRNDGKVDIGGGPIADLIVEVDAGLSSYERILVLFKNEIAAAVMASAETDAE
jgi:hypothetical protein